MACRPGSGRSQGHHLQMYSNSRLLDAPSFARRSCEKATEPGHRCIRGSLSNPVHEAAAVVAERLGAHLGVSSLHAHTLPARSGWLPGLAQTAVGLAPRRASSRPDAPPRADSLRADVKKRGPAGARQESVITPTVT
jgi:hypothetical protein